MTSNAPLTILVLGSGGREHAMALCAKQSLRCGRLLVSPGNAGMPGERFNIAVNDVEGVVALCVDQKVDLVLVGPEAALAAGIVDALVAADIQAFGPTRELAQLESSKAFTRALANTLGIPSPRYATFAKGQADDATKWWKNLDTTVVIKQSGLAGGKGVDVPSSTSETIAAISAACAIGEVVVEECLRGPEVSLIALCDGTSAIALPIAQDHKRIAEGDLGPNTGGMGAYAPVTTPYATDELCALFIQPVLDHFAALGTPYKGVLYAGLMLTDDGPRLLEYNCRFGDPEAQVLLSLLNTDLVEIVLACIGGTLANVSVKIKSASALAVVVVAADYPANPMLGDIVTGLAIEELQTNVYHGGTESRNGDVVTSAGRVVTVVGVGADLATARDYAYKRVEKISFAGSYYRRDIAWRAPAASLTTYSGAGVDIDEGNRAVELLKESVASTSNDKVLRGVGAFGGALDVSFLKEFKHPVLVASTDGVGTKVELAARTGRVRGTGHDIVNHCINDVLVQGAKPMFFLDYLASSRIDAEMVAEVVAGMSAACADSGTVLLGGETAEMPGVYAPGAFDIAGTLVGVVERDELLPRSNIAPGDVLIGLASSGPHTNGYSLLRKIFEWLPLNVAPPPLTRPLIDALLEPHRSYLQLLSPLLVDTRLKALVHITGGGLVENIPRVLPCGVSAKVTLGSWPTPPLFQLVEQLTSLGTDELYRTLNMGIGMVLIVNATDASAVQKLIPEDSWIIGELCASISDSDEVVLL